MQIIKQLSFVPKFQSPFFFKDCSLKFLSNKFDEDFVKEVISITELGITNPKKFITYDVGYQVFKEGTKSCRNTGWHVDGVGNEYLMYIVGDFRTEFNTDIRSEVSSREKLLEFNNSLNLLIKHCHHLAEVPDATLIKYTSSDVHRGRVADREGSRFFLRVCSSDYLVPHNKQIHL